MSPNSHFGEARRRPLPHARSCLPRQDDRFKTRNRLLGEVDQVVVAGEEEHLRPEFRSGKRLKRRLGPRWVEVDEHVVEDDGQWLDGPTVLRYVGQAEREVELLPCPGAELVRRSLDPAGMPRPR